MGTQVLDLDGSITQQAQLMQRCRPQVIPMGDLAPTVRLGCRFKAFRQVERRVPVSSSPTLTFIGSGDFHHVSLALVRKLQTPCNLLVIDNHPDWMRGVPFLHCGTWLYHAARLPQVQRIFHVGGDVDFDNHYRWMAPWPLLRSGKIVTIPSVRQYQRGPWKGIPTTPIRDEANVPANASRIEELVEPYARELAGTPLYISLDRDVMTAADSVVNWDSGHLRLGEVCLILDAFIRAAGGNLAGIDIVGDWSPVRVTGMLRRFLHATEHEAMEIDAERATERNEQTNLALLDSIERTLHVAQASRERAA